MGNFVKNRVVAEHRVLQQAHYTKEKALKAKEAAKRIGETIKGLLKECRFI